MSDTSKIYIDIDSLMDTRQGVLMSLMDQEDVLKMVSSEEYNTRVVDDFTIDMTAYKHRRELGDIAYLSKSTITYMEVVLKSKLTNISKRNAFNNSSSEPEVILNTYPYRLTKKQADLVRSALFVRLDECCLITLVCDPPDVWSPGHIKSNGVYAFYAYSFGKWMQANCHKLETTDLRETQMFFACVGDERVGKEELKSIHKLGFRDIFSYTEYLLSGVTKLTMLPVVFYTNIISATAFLKKNADDEVFSSLG